MKYWATCSSVRLYRSLVRLLCTFRFARAIRCAHSFARSLTSLTTSLLGKWMIRWLFFLFFFSILAHSALCVRARARPRYECQVIFFIYPIFNSHFFGLRHHDHHILPIAPCGWHLIFSPMTLMLSMRPKVTIGKMAARLRAKWQWWGSQRSSSPKQWCFL